MKFDDSKIDGDSLRSYWTFTFTTDQILDAARKKLEVRNERLDWWTGRKQLVMDEIRKSGLEITESQAAAYASNAGIAPQLKVKPELQAKIAECHMKILEHSAAAREYAGWMKLMQARPGEDLELRQGDFLYFFGDN